MGRSQLSLLQLGQLLPPIRDELATAVADFWIDRGMVLFERLVLEAETLTLEGEGQLRLDDWRWSLRLQPSGRVPGWSDLVSAISGTIAAIDVRGTPAEPVLEVVAASRRRSTRTTEQSTPSPDARDTAPEAPSEDPELDPPHPHHRTTRPNRRRNPSTGRGSLGNRRSAASWFHRDHHGDGAAARSGRGRQRGTQARRRPEGTPLRLPRLPPLEGPAEDLDLRIGRGRRRTIPTTRPPGSSAA